MRRVCKKTNLVEKAYRLGTNSNMEQLLLKQGKMRLLPDGTYEIFSRESGPKRGQIALAGDYLRVDTGGYPYPNKKEWFETNYIHLKDDQYEKKPQILNAWEAGDVVSEEMDFLLKSHRLLIDEENEERYFSAELWGTILFAAKNAVVVFYETKRGEDGTILEIDFNFIDRNEFLKTYTYVN